MLPDDPRHGSSAGYVAGCREQCCKTAIADWTRHARTRRYLHGELTVDATGTKRRIRALMALGWSTRVLDEHLGRKRTYTAAMLLSNGSIHQATAKQYRDLYERLSMQLPPQETRYEKQVATRVRNYAARMGYAPPLAWDDIDDPNEKPTGYAKPKLDLATTRAADLEHLAHMGDNLEGACKALGLSVNTLWVWCKRNGHRDLYERLAERSRTQENQYTTTGAVH